MTEKKKAEYLRILKDMSTKDQVAGGIANRMFSDLRRKFPWHFLMFSWKYKSEIVINVHKRVILDQYQAKVEILSNSKSSGKRSVLMPFPLLSQSECSALCSFVGSEFYSGSQKKKLNKIFLEM